MKTKANNRAIAILSVLAGLIYTVSLIFSVINGIRGSSESLDTYWEQVVGSESSGLDETVSLRSQRLVSDDAQFVDAVKNLKDDTILPVRYSEVDVIVPEDMPNTFLGVITFLVQIITLLALVPMLFYVPYLFYKLIYSIYKGKIFTHDNVKKLNRMGWITVIAFVLITTFAYLNYYNVQQLIELENYHVSPPDFRVIIQFALSPIIVLIAGQVMKKALLMKEDQDLTI